MKKYGFIALMFLFGMNYSHAQKMIHLEGDKGFDFIVGQSLVKVEFDYSEMGVGDYDNEEDYVNKKVKEGNDKEAGKGDKWKDSWYGSRARVYQPKFITLFNKTLEKKGISVEENLDDAPITLIVKTTFTEPGWNIGVSSRPAAVSFEYTFVKSDTREVLARMSQKMVPGSQAMGMDFDTSTRISESYAKAGKMLAGHVYKAIKKK